MHGLIHSDYIQQALHAPVRVTPLRLQRQQRLWAFSVAGNFFWNTSLGKFIKWGLRKELRNLIFKSSTLLREKKKLPKWFRHTDSTENLRHLKTGSSPMEIYQNVYQKGQPNLVACTWLVALTLGSQLLWDFAHGTSKSAQHSCVPRLEWSL